MEFGINSITELIIKKELIIEDGVKIICGDKVRPIFFSDGENIVIDFEAPFVYLIISKLGPVTIFEIKRKINKIIIGPKTYTIDIADFPNITRNIKT
ncbi:MAG TPA: hypothetical protein PKX31_00200 [Chitinophagaceae bacterium]|nr:hypothetical protein [Chitinophagaceae bacterium]